MEDEHNTFDKNKFEKTLIFLLVVANLVLVVIPLIIAYLIKDNASLQAIFDAFISFAINIFSSSIFSVLLWYFGINRFLKKNKHNQDSPIIYNELIKIKEIITSKETDPQSIENKINIILKEIEVEIKKITRSEINIYTDAEEARNAVIQEIYQINHCGNPKKIKVVRDMSLYDIKGEDKGSENHQAAKNKFDNSVDELIKNQNVSYIDVVSKETASIEYIKNQIEKRKDDGTYSCYNIGELPRNTPLNSYMIFDEEIIFIGQFFKNTVGDRLYISIRNKKVCKYFNDNHKFLCTSNIAKPIKENGNYYPENFSHSA